LAEAAQVWRQIPQVILQYPYAEVDFWDDPNMVLPPREVFDHRGMLIDDVDMYGCIFMMFIDDVDSRPYVYDIDTDTICCLFVCANVAPRRREVELQRASASQEPERLPRGERRR
jgi:hypothetical protein